MMFNTGDLLLDAVVLSIVARTPEGTYGYKITQDVRSKMDVPESTFYPLLKQMELDGYLEVYHKDLGGRSRRFYKITDAGRERLVFCQKNWNSYLQSAGNLLMTDNAVTESSVSSAQTEVVVPEVQETASSDGISIAAEGSIPAVDEFEFSLGGNEILDEEETIDETSDDLFDFGLNIDIPAPASEDIAAPQTAVAADSSSENTKNIITESKPVNETVAEDIIPAASEVNKEEIKAVEEKEEKPAAPVYRSYVPTPPVFATTPPVFASEPPVLDIKSLEPEKKEVEDNSASEEASSSSAPIFEDKDDEADFLAEMALGDLGDDEEIPIVSKAPVDSKSATELEGLLSQLRTFESNMSAMHERKESKAGSDISISDLNAVAELLTAASVQPAEKASTAPANATISKQASVPNKPVLKQVQTESTRVDTEVKHTQPVSSQQIIKSVDNAVSTASANNAAKAKFTEIRNAETDDTLNSLVDLLKDEPVKKSGFFKRRKDKSANDTPVENKPISKIVKEPTPVVDTANKVSSQTSEVQHTHTYTKFQEIRNPETDDTVNSLVDLLKNDEPATKAKLFKPKAAITPAVEKYTPVQEAPKAPEPKKVAPVQNTHKIELTEVRSPETDESVNSLVDLLKDDSKSTKSKRFRPWGSKEKVQPPIEKVERVEQVQPVVEKKTAPIVHEMPAHHAKATEIRNPESDETVNSLVDLLRDDTPEEKSTFFKRKSKAATPPVERVTPVATAPVPEIKKPAVPVSKRPETTSTVTPVAKAEPVATAPTPAFKAETPVAKAKPTAMPTIKPATSTSDNRTLNMNIIDAPENDDSVDNLVELLMGNKPESHSSSIFGRSAKPFSPKSATIEENKSVTSRPAAAKSFDVKAAAPNAKPVETRATITKPLEAKAISTNPTVPKPAEAKAVEAKAVATPKPEVKEEKKDDVAMDSFKYRLMQAHLLPDEDK